MNWKIHRAILIAAIWIAEVLSAGICGFIAALEPGVVKAADGRVVIAMVEGQRSINVALSAAMICGEALRQTG